MPHRVVLPLLDGKITGMEVPGHTQGGPSEYQLSGLQTPLGHLARLRHTREDFLELGVSLTLRRLPQP